MSQRTCEYYQDQRLCEHEVSCARAEACVLVIHRADEEEYAASWQEMKAEEEKLAAESTFKAGF